MTFYLMPPTEKQEGYIRDLCEQRGLEPPQVIASSDEASRIITEILERRYVTAEAERDAALRERDEARQALRGVVDYFDAPIGEPKGILSVALAIARAALAVGEAPQQERTQG